MKSLTKNFLFLAVAITALVFDRLFGMSHAGVTLAMAGGLATIGDAIDEAVKEGMADIAKGKDAMVQVPNEEQAKAQAAVAVGTPEHHQDKKQGKAALTLKQISDLVHNEQELIKAFAMPKLLAGLKVLVTADSMSEVTAATLGEYVYQAIKANDTVQGEIIAAFGVKLPDGYSNEFRQRLTYCLFAHFPNAADLLLKTKENKSTSKADKRVTYWLGQATEVRNLKLAREAQAQAEKAREADAKRQEQGHAALLPEPAKAEKDPNKVTPVWYKVFSALYEALGKVHANDAKSMAASRNELSALFSLCNADRKKLNEVITKLSQ